MRTCHDALLMTHTHSQIRRDQAIEMLSDEGLDAVVQQIEVEAEEAKTASQGASKEPTP
jgi:hypothetical protein